MSRNRCEWHPSSRVENRPSAREGEGEGGFAAHHDLAHNVGVPDGVEAGGVALRLTVLPGPPLETRGGGDILTPTSARMPWEALLVRGGEGREAHRLAGLVWIGCSIFCVGVSDG